MDFVNLLHKSQLHRSFFGVTEQVQGKESSTSVNSSAFFPNRKHP